MLNTPPESVACDDVLVEKRLMDKPMELLERLDEGTTALVAVRKIEASTAVELERLRQTALTARLRIAEESRTQRSACLAALAKRCLEECQRTERERIACAAEARQAEIAAGVKKAELEAARPDFKPVFLLLLLFRRPPRLQMRIFLFLLLLKTSWNRRWSDVWQGVVHGIRGLLRRSFQAGTRSESKL